MLTSGKVILSSQRDYAWEGQLNEAGVTLNGMSKPSLVQTHINIQDGPILGKECWCTCGEWVMNNLCPVTAVAAYFARRDEPQAYSLSWHQNYISHVRFLLVKLEWHCVPLS